MMSVATLRDVPLRRRYSSGRQDLVQDFFRPCLLASTSYDRAVGFFSSSCYVLIGLDVAEFVQRGGRMRLVCCPRLSELDVEALREGYSHRAASTALVHEIDQTIDDPIAHPVTRLLATIVALGAMDIRIAFRRQEGSIFHDKVGIFTDPAGNRVSFDGSTNESWRGWSESGNFEGFHAFASWVDEARVQDDVEYFESVWAGREPGLEVLPFPDVAAERLDRLANPEGIEHAQRRVQEAVGRHASEAAQGRPALRAHQREVLADWAAGGHRGIVEHATGSGKTITAMAAIDQAVGAGEAVIVAVPAVLIDQWRRELVRYFGTRIRLLEVASGHGEWRAGAALRNFLVPGTPNVVVASIDTAVTIDFTQRLAGLHPLLLIIDEVHRVGSPERRRLLGEVDADWRLGLSATWEREGDPVGTAAILSYFERVLEPVYTLQDALRDGHLSPYRYIIHTLSLTPHERAEWAQQSAAIGRAIAASRGDITDGIRQMLIRRARIIKKAEGKIPLAVTVLQAELREGDAWLVYCDDTDQLRELRRQLLAVGIRALEYHRQVMGAEEESLAEFERTGGVMLAIRCLDEGVDIPRIDHALILASATTRREFIQRRGRVLRKADRKYMAEIHDLLTDAAGFDDPSTVGYLRTEVARAREFASSARDSVAARILLDRWERDLLGVAPAAASVMEDTTAGFEEDDGSSE